MKKSIKTVVSLTTNIVELIEKMVVILKNKTNYKVNKSLIIRIAILYLSAYEETTLKKLLNEYKLISKWQTDKSAIREMTVTINQKCLHLLDLLTKIDVDYKLYKSGIIRLAILKFSEEKNFDEIFLNLVAES